MKLFQISVLFLFVAGCGAELPVSARNLRAKDQEVTGPDRFLPSPKARVGAEVLDSEALAVTGLGIALGEGIKTTVPVVAYQLPRLADYAQILKCDSKANLGNLRNLDMSYSNSVLLSQEFLKTDFWKLATENPLCQLVTDGYSAQGQASFPDSFSNSGSFVYLVRACVTANRIDGLNAQFPRECSRWIAISQPLEGYVNTEKRVSADKSEQIRKIRDKGDAIARRLHGLAVRITDQLSACDANWAKNQEKKALREGLFDLIGKGVEFGVSTFGPKEVSVDGGGLGSALKDIFASPNDYPSTCAAALKSRLEGEALRTEFDALSAQYSKLLEGITLPEAVTVPSEKPQSTLPAESAQESK